MRYPASEMVEKRGRLVGLSSRLFRKNGLEGVSIGDLMEAAGLTHGGFYNYFASKNALQSACIQRSTECVLDELEQLPGTEKGKRSYFAKYLSSTHRDAPDEGCVIASLGPEISRDPALRPALSRHVADVIAKMSERLPWSGRNKRREAIRALATMVGAMVLARAVDDVALSEEILGQAREVLGTGTRAGTDGGSR